MKTTKGQAAMEFLMTYGWAILAAIIVIGILGYYYFSKSTLTPNAGVVNPPFYLVAANAKTTGINLELKNNGGDDLGVIFVNISGTGCTTGNISKPTFVAAGATTLVVLTCSPGNPDTVYKGNIVVYYNVSGSALEQTSTGSITKTIVA